MPKKTKAAQGKPTITKKGKTVGRPAKKGRVKLPPKSEALKKAKFPRGRPTKYDVLMNERAFRMAFLGSTDEQIAESLGIDLANYYLWQTKYPDFREAISKGKADPDSMVEASLYRRAVGVDGVLPDPSSMFFWLKNRKKEVWRDKHEIGVTDTDGNDVTMFQLPTNDRGDKTGIETKSEG